MHRSLWMGGPIGRREGCTCFIRNHVLYSDVFSIYLEYELCLTLENNRARETSLFVVRNIGSLALSIKPSTCFRSVPPSILISCLRLETIALCLG